MKRAVVVLAAWAALLTGAAAARAEAPVPFRRFALLVGANRGAPDRVSLRYAVSDAERVADVVARMGRVRPEDRIVLREPSRRAFLAAFDHAQALVRAARERTTRLEILVYYSGHADEQGLMLGRETVSYRELRSAVQSIHADVGITVLDACASGAITRLKGGSEHPGFLNDEASAAQGHAFLTSSSATEAAQESEHLRGSFFTHALLSGLRGAADLSGDGRVTLNEAYQFAFQETLAQTASTQGGAQHPAYDIQMTGTGEVVMTDVRKNSASLILDEEYDGRFYVLNDRRQVVAELYKAPGRRVELGLEPGKYDVQFEETARLLGATVVLADGQRQLLLREALVVRPRRSTQRRGAAASGAVDLGVGASRVQLGAFGRVTLRHAVRPDLAVELHAVEPMFRGPYRSVLGGARYYPTLPGGRRSVLGRLRPHVGLLLGGLQTIETGAFTAQELDWASRGWRRRPQADFGIAIAAGLDLQIDRRLNFAVDHQTQISGGRRQEDTWLSLGWSFDF